MLAYLAAHQRTLAYLLQVGQLCLSLVLVTAIFVPLEHFFSVRKTQLFYPGWSTNLIWYFLDGMMTGLVLGPPTALIAWGVHSLLPTTVTGIAAGLPLWAKMIAAMVVGEVGFYWGHRWSHHIPLLWRFHAVHHSAKPISYLVNTRAHPVDLVFTRMCGLVLLYATGLVGVTGPHPALIPALVLFVGSLWSYFIHSNVRVRLGWLEEVISTPAFHHWHHTLEDHKDRNFSSMVPVMDRIFGTYYLPKSWPAEYGTDTYMPETVAGQLLQPFAPVAKPQDLARVASCD